MKFSTLIISLCIFKNLLFGQQIYQISATENLSSFFNEDLLQNYEQIQINLEGNNEYRFLEERSYKSNLELIFNIIPEDTCTLILRGLKFENFRSIKFLIQKPCNIKLENSQFRNCENLTMEFGAYETLYNSHDTKIKIANCLFEDLDLKNNNKFLSYLLLFKRISGSSDFSVLRNVRIENCSFIMKDDHNSFLKNGYFPSRNFVFFERYDQNVSYQDVSIVNNTFEADAKYYRSFGIIFTNNKNFSDFRGPQDSRRYLNNNNILISDNILGTTSVDPGHGIFIQGPYRDIRIENNRINNFGAYIKSVTLNADGAIHLYGARFGRNSSYSDNTETVLIRNNFISTRSHGIILSGVKNAEIRSNNIVILPESPFYSDSTEIKRLDRIGILNTTGDVIDPSKQSENIIVEYDSVFCNGIDASVGIAIHPTKNFILRNNYIYKPDNFGILYYSNKNFVNQYLGSSIIEYNTIDYANQDFNSLNSYFYKYTNTQYAGINFTRVTNSTYADEYLVIRNNSVRLSDSRIKSVVLNPGQDKEKNNYINKENILIDNL